MLVKELRFIVVFKFAFSNEIIESLFSSRTLAAVYACRKPWFIVGSGLSIASTRLQVSVLASRNESTLIFRLGLREHIGSRTFNLSSGIFYQMTNCWWEPSKGCSALKSKAKLRETSLTRESRLSSSISSKLTISCLKSCSDKLYVIIIFFIRNGFFRKKLAQIVFNNRSYFLLAIFSLQKIIFKSLSFIINSNLFLRSKYYLTQMFSWQEIIGSKCLRKVKYYQIKMSL